jgi:hypothetical protein
MRARESLGERENFQRDSVMRAQKNEREFSRRSHPISRRSHSIPTFQKAEIALFPVPMRIRKGLHDTANGNLGSRNHCHE